MADVVSTNIHIPKDLWRSVKMLAAHEGRSMRDIILEGIRIVLGKETAVKKVKKGGQKLLLEFSGRAPTDAMDGSIHHDRYLYPEK